MENLWVNLWSQSLSAVRNRISPESFETWFSPVSLSPVQQPVDGTNSVIVLRVPNRFYADWISAHFGDLLGASLAAAANIASVRIEWEVEETSARVVERPSAPPPEARKTSPGDIIPDHEGTAVPSSVPPAVVEAGAKYGLNPKYTFDQFVVGPSNQLGHAAAVAATSGRGKRYNPLFIYGGVGLGKTHLVNAVGHQVLANNANARILYLSAERFTNEFIWALKNHTINDFREKYRVNCDVLLMDDIQFLSGREQTQEEFFHTFNELYQRDCQIVVTSDKYPQQLGEMEERLISRFQWGLVADIQAPELDTRIAILKRKAELENIDLADDVALFLAQMVKSNVRELEGTLLRLAVRAALVKREIDLEFAKETLRGALPTPETATSVEDIQRAVCGYFNIRLGDLKGRRRHRAVAFPRMVAMYLCRQRLDASYPALGDSFGGKDHTTVMSAVRKIQRMVDAEDASVRGVIEAIERKLSNG